mmetsp:Transcript_130983/g.230904  ORF Transcript_130983/g.230904 Transcript_130983/m.230904 type:complete len:87 (-) Transcript_130983:5-265(-)
MSMSSRHQIPLKHICKFAMHQWDEHSCKQHHSISGRISGISESGLGKRHNRALAHPTFVHHSKDASPEANGIGEGLREQQHNNHTH